MSSHDDAEESTAAAACRKRSRRLRGFIYLVTLLGFVILGVWAILRDEPPPNDEDLRTHRRSVKEEDNGFQCLYQAAFHVVPAGAERVRSNSLSFDREAADALAKRNEAIFTRIDKCLALPEFQADPVESLWRRLPRVSPFGDLGDALASRARLYIESGWLLEAYEDALRLVHLGRRIGQAEGSLFEYMEAVSMRNKGIRMLILAAVRSGLPVEVLRRGARDLDPRSVSSEDFKNALRAEYVFMANTIEDLAARTTKSLFSQLKYLVVRRRVWKPNQMRRLIGEEIRLLIAASSIPPLRRELPDIREMYGSIDEYEVPFLDGGKLMLRIMNLSYRKALGRMDLSHFATSATQALFAVLAFKSETGVYPESLDALVPAYLPFVPLDPFDTKPLRYSAANRVLYSVGEDGADMGGSKRAGPKALQDIWEPTLRFSSEAWTEGSLEGSADEAESSPEGASRKGQ